MGVKSLFRKLNLEKQKMMRKNLIVLHLQQIACLLSMVVQMILLDQLNMKKILSALEKGGTVIITMVEERYPRNVYPEVFVSNNNKLKRVQL